jgi:hypothetical protein
MFGRAIAGFSSLVFSTRPSTDLPGDEERDDRRSKEVRCSSERRDTQSATGSQDRQRMFSDLPHVIGVPQVPLSGNVR